MKLIRKNVLFLSSLVFLSSCGISGKNYNVDDYRLVLDFHDDYKIMQITDIHIGIESNLTREFNFLKASIKEADPDLIIVTGDTFTYSNKAIVNNFFDFLNSTCDELTSSDNNTSSKVVRWTFTYGNHDNQGDYNRFYINDTIKKYSPTDLEKPKEERKYAAFVDYTDDNINGFTNFFIDLVDKDNKNDIKYKLNIIDSHSYHYNGSVFDYDIIHEDQIEHVENIYKNSIDKDYIGLAFFHIPLYEVGDAKKVYETLEDKSVMGNAIFGEKSCPGYENQNQFARMRASNIIGYFYGHDHLNAGEVLYNYDSDDASKKAIFSYGVKSTDQIYHSDDMIGYKLINLKSDVTVEEFLTMDYINNNYTNVLDRNQYYEEF